jgi:hypothetical protein
MLTYAGTIPFIAAALAFLLHFGTAHAGFAIGPYGIVILSFMAGVEWGTYMTSPLKPRLNLLLISNVVALAAWASFLMVDGRTLFACDAVLFALLLLVDVSSKRAGLIAPWFFRLRLSATIIVEACLMTLIFVH